MRYSMGSEPRTRRLSTQDLLKKEILQLQKELEAQKAIRAALEKALNCQPLFDDPAYKSPSKPAEDLIKEVALLEMEVLCLEKYLQSLSNCCVHKISDLAVRRGMNDENNHLGAEEMVDTVHRSNTPSSKEKLSPGILVGDKLTDASIHRSHSSLSRNSACSFRASPSYDTPEIYHSLPLSMLERLRIQNSTSKAGLGDCPSHETPNWLSEEMVKCISLIFCHLSDHPLSQHNSFGINGSKEPRKSFFPMVQIRGLVRNSQMLKSTHHLLHHYRSLTSRLAKVDPRKLKHEEKLAFWINVHNSLVMHAFLVHGIPRGNIRRTSLVLKAAYNVGGLTVDIESIQTSILRCRTPRPAQWLNLLLFPKTKFKFRIPLNSYAIKPSEPRLRFALSTGCKSDPPIRLYSENKVLKQLESAKEEYIQMNVKRHKETTLLVPKNVELFVKDTDIYRHSSMVEEIFHALPSSWRKKVTDNGRPWKKIDWIPHDFCFAVLLSNELVSNWAEKLHPKMSEAGDQNQIAVFLAKILELKAKLINFQTSGENGNESKVSLDAENQQLEGDEEAKCLLNIKEALESLEGHLASLQALAQQQLRERETTLTAIEQSQAKLLKELEEYKGKSLEVIQEVTAFAGETKNINDLLTPFLKFLQNGGTENANSQNPDNNGDQPLQKAMAFISTAAKTALTILGALTALTLVSKQDMQVQLVNLFNQIVNKGTASVTGECPPGKIALVNNGEIRCIVKERVEVPFESGVGAPDVSYGSG